MKYAGPMGYETRSWAAALIMLASDGVAFWHRTKPFAWSGPVVISSIGGLGDLTLQLPLIDSLVAKARDQGFQVHVALRPDALPIAECLGWPCFAWEIPSP